MSKFIFTGFSDEISSDIIVQMDELDKLGIKNIEMRGVNGKSIVNHSLEEAINIKRLLDERGFKVSAIGSPIGKISIAEDFEPHLQLFKHTVEIAKIIQTKYIRVFSFFIPEGEEPENYRDEVMRRFNEFVNVLEGTELVLLHENEQKTYADVPERCMDLFKTINSTHIKGIMDIGNFVKCGVKDNVKAYEYLKNEIIYFHIKDATTREKHFLPIGQGQGMAKELLTNLNDEGFEGFLSIEAHLQYLPLTGPEQFNVACGALKKLMFEVTGEVY